MHSIRFDRLTRAFAKSLTRRGLLAVAGGLAAGFGQQVARGSQLGPGTCGAEAEVCTLLLGCCSGLTCVTSGTNTSYGVCVPGPGGMMAASSSLISPHSETIEQEVATLAETVAAMEADTSAEDLQAERDARIAAIKARKDAKRSKRKTRLDTKRTTQQTRKDDQQARRLEAREAAEAALGPSLEFALLNPGGITGTETVKVGNMDDISVVLRKIESVLNPDENNASNRTVPPGGSFNFYSGITGDISDQDEQLWIDKPICSGIAGAGFRITVGIASEVNHDFVVLCDGPPVVRVNETPAATPRRKRKKNDGKNDKKKKR